MNVSVFIPCYIDQLKPQLGFQMITILEKLGCQIKVFPKAFCCGQPAYNSGFQKEAKDVFLLFMEEHLHSDYIVMPSASCAGFLKNYGSAMLQEDKQGKNQNPAYLDTIPKIYELCAFLDQRLKVELLNAYFPYKVGYHTSCASLREYDTTTHTRNILSKIKGLELVPFDFQNECCGFGGTFAEKFSDLSISMAKHKLDQIKNAGIEYVVSNDSSCLLQLESVAQKYGYEMKFMNVLELLV